MFFYFQAPRSDGNGRRHFWRYIDARTHEIKENRYEIAQRIACLPDEPRYIGDQDVFALQDKVIEHILAAEREAEAKAAAPTAVDPIQQTVTEELKNSLRRRTIDRERAKTCIAFLGQPMGRSLHVKLREAYDLWTQSHGDQDVVSAVAELAEQFGKARPTADARTRLSREDLELICFEYLTCIGSSAHVVSSPATGNTIGRLRATQDSSELQYSVTRFAWATQDASRQARGFNLGRARRSVSGGAIRR